MAPTLFSMMFSATLTYSFQDVDAGFPIYTALMASYLTLEGCKPNLRYRQMWLISSSMQMTEHRMPKQRKNANGCRSHVKSM